MEVPCHHLLPSDSSFKLVVRWCRCLRFLLGVVVVVVVLLLLQRLLLPLNSLARLLCLDPWVC